MTDTSATIAVLMPGDMGHAVGRALGEHGHRVVTCLTGRSDHSRTLAAAGNLEDLGSLELVVAEADMVLSILPPASAPGLARDVAAAMQAADARPIYVDCNAIAPETAKGVAETITDAGAAFIDAGIIGLAPGKGGATRFYVSGTDTGPMQTLDGKGIQVLALGPHAGQASAIKMCYAALTKGTWTLQLALLMAAERYGLYDDLISEFAFSQSATLKTMEGGRLPRIPADAARWVGEMEEIAQSFRDVGVPGGFHEGAAEVFRTLAQTPFAAETRETWDASRTLAEAIPVYAQYLDAGDGEPN